MKHCDIRIFFHSQANNAYIFPGFGLGLVMSGAIRVHKEMLLAACKYTTPSDKSCLYLIHSTTMTHIFRFLICTLA